MSTGPSARTTVLRNALLFTPFLAVAVVVLAFIARDALAEGVSVGDIVGLVLVGFVVVLLGYQVVQSVRDLFTRPVETTGLVERHWSRNDFFIFQNSYIFLGRDVFRLTPEQSLDVELGDTVRVVHYPHTSTVESIEMVARGGERGSDDDA